MALFRTQDAQAKARTLASIENPGNLAECRRTGISTPIDAVGSGPYRAGSASTGFGHEDAICENDEVMQISPVRATMRSL
jgi:hypothetical protein